MKSLPSASLKTDIDNIYSSLKNFVKAKNGTHVLNRILIATNGNAAIKALRSLREWSLKIFGTPKVFEFVVLATPNDIEANSEYINEGDYLVEMPIGPSSHNYANINLIVQAAEEYGCDAVWPGWGHASENYKLPLALKNAARHITWIGPSANAMLALGDKIISTLIAQSINVRCVPWSGSSIQLSFTDEDNIHVSSATLDLAGVHNVEECLAACKSIGFPSVLKASSGGGGKGIRVVHCLEEVETAFRQVSSEIQNSFIFVMKFLPNCRHLEVQVICDMYGDVVVLGARDCTIQRRCQKLIEESPVTTASQEVIDRMVQSAISLCKKAKYVGVGTCEFIYNIENDKEYFLEVNSRLQVEHVVTEVVYDINLVAAQIQVAMGIPLSEIEDINKAREMKCGLIHCMAGRITAEHAEASFQPTCGQVSELYFRPTMHCWGYFSIGATGRVHQYADSQIGHLFAWGDNRENARKNLIIGLRGLTIRGEIRTNIEALMKILQMDDFIENKTCTSWLEHTVTFETPTLFLQNNEECLQELRGVLFAAAYEAYTAFSNNESEFLRKIGQGQFSPPLIISYNTQLIYRNYRFDLECLFTGCRRISVKLNSSVSEVVLRSISETCADEAATAVFLISGGFDGRSRRVIYKFDSTGMQVTFDGMTCTFTKEINPTEVRAPLSGKLCRWLIPNGANVMKGQTYAEIEIMKMYMQLQVTESGILSHALSEGAIFKTGDLLATLELPDSYVVQSIQPFDGVFPNVELHKKSDIRDLAENLRIYRRACERLKSALDGYYCSDDDAREALINLLERVFNPEIPKAEIKELLSTLEPELPSFIISQFYELLEKLSLNRASLDDKTSSLPSILESLDDYIADKPNLKLQVEQLTQVILRFESGSIYIAIEIIVSLLNHYLSIEEIFDSFEFDTPSKILLSKRTELNAHQLSIMARSHQALSQKNLIINLILSCIRQIPDCMENLHLFYDSLQRLSNLTKIEYSPVSLRARQLLLTRRKKTFIEKTIAFAQLLEVNIDRKQANTTTAAAAAATALSSYNVSGTGSYPSHIFNSPGSIRNQLLISAGTPLGSTSANTCNLMFLPNIAASHSSNFSTINLFSNVKNVNFPLTNNSSNTERVHTFNTMSVNPHYLIQTYASDIEEAGDDTLIALFSHPNKLYRKVACQIYIWRHFEKFGLHDLRVCCNGESWIFQPNSKQEFAVQEYQNYQKQGVERNICSKMDEYMFRSVPATPHDADFTEVLYEESTAQRVNQLLAVWVCSAVLSYDYLSRTCDVILKDRCLSTQKSKTGVTDDAFKQQQLNYGLDVESRLHHMLNAFSGAPSGGRSQLMVAMAFQSSEHFSTMLDNCLDEYSSLQSYMPSSPPTVDGKVLMIFISDVQDFTSSTEFENSTVHCYSWLEQEIQKRSNRLAELDFQVIAFAFLMGRTPFDVKTNNRPISRSSINYWDRVSDMLVEESRPNKTFCLLEDQENHNKPCISEAVVDAKQDVWKKCPDITKLLNDRAILDLDLFAPRYMYFRNIRALPSVFSSAEDIDEESSLPEGSLIDTCHNFTDNADHKELPGFKCCPLYVEEVLLRNVVCSQFGHLELQRLIRFHVNPIPTAAPFIRIFEASPKMLSQNRFPSKQSKNARLFVRILVQVKLKHDEEDACSELEKAFVTGLNALESAQKTCFTVNSHASPNHHVLMNVGLYCSQDLTRQISPAVIETVVSIISTRYCSRLINQRIGTVELRFAQTPHSENEMFVPIRVIITNPTQQSIRIQKYVEISDPTTGELVYSALDATDTLSVSVKQPNHSFSNQTPMYMPMRNTQTDSSYDGTFVNTPHPLSGPLDEKRAFAASLSTIYIYDFLELFEEAIKKTWRMCPKYFVPGYSNKNSNILSRAANTNSNINHSNIIENTNNKGLNIYSNNLNSNVGENFNTMSYNNNATHPHFANSNENENLYTLYSIRESYANSTDSVYNPPNTFLPDKVLESIELILNPNGSCLQEVVREPGQNNIGMVAWRVFMRTPEFPRGRRIILIGNDVTFEMGTFGVKEDLLFQRASELARKEGIPRIYVAVNSGARMGLAEEVQKCMNVEWVNPEQPSLGFKYLYLTEEDYALLHKKNSVVAEPVINSNGQRVYKLTTVIGSELGLGIENLMGSGLIAGETSRAYNSTVTITYVTGRDVGIGAYVTRLGQRVIQKVSSAPILLTGYQALNRLIGRNVYCSNDELGGSDIMASNGVTHIIVQHDSQGCEEIIKWLSYIPEHRDGALPIKVDPTDPINREVSYTINSLTEDPRLMLTGCTDTTGKWLGGLVDRNSFREVLADWAKSVVVGRARLGGIPIGVITVETRVTETLIPADPALTSSTETKLIRAGQVWFPDSAYKTAQAISDFDKEEIPLIILANWRGFSGGRRDMFFEVLKFGSFIVDALVKFRQPCIVYIPPKAELRGGAWVVLDLRINSNFMSMFAAPDSRGGVLEPSATVEIKYRGKALSKLADRLDPKLKQYSIEDAALAHDGVPVDDPKRQLLKEKREERLSTLLPIYKQVAAYFADLHDTAVRMKSKSAIIEIVPWDKSRQFFYWTLRKQLILFNLRLEIMKANPTLGLESAEKLIYNWAAESGHVFECPQISSNLTTTMNMNALFVNWACHSLVDISRRLSQLKKDYLKEQVINICRKTPGLIIEAIRALAPNIDSNTLSKLCSNNFSQ